MDFGILFHASLLIIYSCKVSCFFRESSLHAANNVSEACGTYGVCHCYNIDYNKDFVVDCNGSIHDMPGNIPTNTTVLTIENTKIFQISAEALIGLPRLKYLFLCCNKIKEIQSGSFQGLRNLKVLDVSNNKLKTLPTKLFEDLTSLVSLDLSNNKLQTLPPKLFQDLSSVYNLSLAHNEITMLHEGCFKGLSSTHILYLEGNEITMLQERIFEGLPQVDFLDLSGNNISQISSGFFNQTGDDNLVTLFLQRNNLTIIYRDAFKGLDKLTLLCLYSNHIHTIEDNVFLLRDLRYIFLFQNDLINITGNPFRSNVMEQLHLYGNEIENFEAQSLGGIPNNTIIYISCDFLTSLPINTKHDNIKCVNSSSLPSTEQGNITALALYTDGFKCDFNCSSDCKCTPCGAGTYGDTVSGGCRSCPVGGFYQDEIAQTEPSQSSWKIPCKLCNEGTYVKEGSGSSAKDCEVCPEGTNQSINAGFRACYCKKNYARTNRYGSCFLCLEKGLDCSNEFQSLLPGYMWNWSVPLGNLTNYELFVKNLKTNTDFSIHANYTGEIPRIFKCPRTESCANGNGSISGNCAKGYTGWLCTNCEPGYYSVLTSCASCPSLVILIVESCLFFAFCALACILLTWQIKRKGENDHKMRSFIDVIIARLKILLGFYQVIGEIFTSLHDITWTGPLVIMGKFISAFEINLLRLFVRPRCFDEKLDLNPKIQFIIGAISPVVIFLVPFTFYQAKKLYVYIRFSPVVRISLRSHFENLKACFVACVVVLWFVIYPPVCSVIFSLYPMSCKSFPLNKDKTYNITRLRSDFDVDCTGLKAYHIFAFILTVIYVVAFPAGLLSILCKYYLRPRKEESCIEELPPDNIDDSNTSLIINRHSHNHPSPPTWLNFLCENYKKNFWFWEIVELARKVTQTLLITLFGWEDRLTVILTTCISVLFLLLHARYRPMKSSYEQGLQMFSLTVIFINVVVAANDFPDEHEGTISIILVVLNIIVLVIIVGELLVTIVVHIKHIGMITFIVASFRRLQASVRAPETPKTD